jgi:hypothetical protein
MELPANTSQPGSAELEGLGKEQALGEATNLGRPGLATPEAIITTVSGGETATASGATETGRTRASGSGSAIPGG